MSRAGQALMRTRLELGATVRIRGWEWRKDFRPVQLTFVLRHFDLRDPIFPPVLLPAYEPPAASLCLFWPPSVFGALDAVISRTH
jgi:hypothetical protein